MSLRFRFWLVAVAALVVNVLGLSALAGWNATAATSPVPSATANGVSPAALAGLTLPTATPAGLPAGTRQDCPRPASPLQEQCQLFTRGVKAARAASRTATGAGVESPKVLGLGWSATALQSAYAITAASATGGIDQGTGDPETVAIVDAYNSVAQVKASLPTYRQNEGLPACDTATGAGCVTIFNEFGKASPLPAVHVTGWEDETVLDVEMVSAICPNCHIDLFEANSANLPDLGTAENSAAKVAKFISNSWSGGDFPGESDFDQQFFNHPGVAITVASGDNGYGAGYPASSQLVTSVGGTYLTSAKGTPRGWHEVVWSGQGTGPGSGTAAGCSSGEPEPAWQPDASGGQSAKQCANRTENDVAAAASGPNGISMYGDTSECPRWCQAFGTSVAAPIIAAIYALAGTPTPNTYPSSYLYQNPADLFHVTSGSDGVCEPARLFLCNAAHSLSDGYNGPTGLGTPDGIADFVNRSAQNIVSVINPGTYDVRAGVRYTLPAVKAYDSAPGQTLTYSASGLPSGLKVNAATGVISGVLPAAPASALVHLTVKDGTGAKSTVSFRIISVKSLTGSFRGVTGPVRLDLAGKCLDDAGNSKAAGAKAVIWSCDGSAAQNWEFVPSAFPGGPGSIRIHGKCLAFNASGKIVLAACGTAISQQWEITGADGGLLNPATGGCLDDPSGSTSNGKQLDLATCDDVESQAWTLPASPVTSGVTGKCVALDHGATSTGAAIVSSACDGSAAQKITLALNSSLRVGGKCLDVSKAGTTNGDTVVLEPCSSVPSQVWEVSSFGMLENANAEKCLADPSNSAVNGRQLVIEDCYGMPGEVWAVS